MACFLVPTATAIVTTTLKKKASPKLHLDKLNLMLWGGAAMSIANHVINHELVPYPPFFTGGFSAIPMELVRVGMPMTLVIVAIWAVMVMVMNRAESKSALEPGN